MNLISLTTVFLRLYALYAYLQSGIYLLSAIASMVTASGADGMDTPYPIILFFLWLIPGVVLWLLARPIAKLACRKLDPEITVPGISIFHCYLTAFVTVSVYYFVGYISDTLTWVHYLITLASAPSKEELDYSELFAVVAPLIFSIVLFLNAHSFAGRLAKLHEKADEPGETTSPS